MYPNLNIMTNKKRPRIGNTLISFEQHGHAKRIIDNPARPVHLLKADLIELFRKHPVHLLALDTRIVFARAANSKHHLVWREVFRQVFDDTGERKKFELGLLHAADTEFHGDHRRAVRSSVKSMLRTLKDPARPATTSIDVMPDWHGRTFLGDCQMHILARLGVQMTT
jgi:hypothetical protein